MFGCKCFDWNRISDDITFEPEPYSLPSPIPEWPEGNGFGGGKINLGEIEVHKITKFESVWSCNSSNRKSKGATFYKPVEIPEGFFSLGHYCQTDEDPLRGFVLVAKETSTLKAKGDHKDHSVIDLPPLGKPLNYTLIWSSDDWNGDHFDECGYFWLPIPPEGYKAMGYIVTNKPDMPSLEEVRCVRFDLTETCETYDLIHETDSKFPKSEFQIWKTRPIHRGMLKKGVSVGTFFCGRDWNSGDDLDIACLKNLNPSLHAMPNLDQIHALIKHYGPTIFFHPDDIYLPSSVPWFFKNGALLYRQSDRAYQTIDSQGSNLPRGETNDGEYWIDLPIDDPNDIKKGNLESAELYVHVKPALGGTFTDIVMWVFCPFNGPATIKVGFVNIALNRIGQHVSDWEHFTLRVSNFTGELWSVYFSQHSGGEWVDAYNLDFVGGNKAAVYSSKSGHASFPHSGNFIQGSSKFGIGVRNDAARSNFYVDSSEKYRIIAAEYLGDGIVIEPYWLQYMREWGPTIVYDSSTEIEKIISHLPFLIRFSVENIFEKFPVELYGEEGPTGPKEKDNWFGDERG